MSISKDFIDAVAEENELRARIMLSNYMITDPSFRDFDESLAYALKTLPELVVPHDGEELNHDVTAWTKEYLDKQCTAVVNNFSKERINLLRNMCAHIYKDKVEETHRREFVRDAQAKRKKAAPSKTKIGAATMGVGAVAAVVSHLAGSVAADYLASSAAAGHMAGTAAAGHLAILSTPLTVAGVAAVAVGGVLIFMDQRGGAGRND